MENREDRRQEVVMEGMGARGVGTPQAAMTSYDGHIPSSPQKTRQAAGRGPRGSHSVKVSQTGGSRCCIR
jgi:hypothetical protein